MAKKDDSERIEPRASSLIPSLRSVGYSLSTAVADIIDNSIAASSRNVWVRAEWDGESSFFSITDDGCGMTESALTEAMRWGSRSPQEPKASSDMGRFGLGLKTASFSQCRRLTVLSKTRSSDPAVRCWDLDYINSCHDWMLLRSVDRNTMSLLKLAPDSSSGTVVLWQRLDRVVPSGTKGDNKKAQARFLQQLEDVKKHLAMVFHRFLEQGTLKIWFNENAVEPWSPFLVSHEATQRLPEEKFGDKGCQVFVRPNVLPHVSKLSKHAHEAGSGPEGWNAQQGFYIYRNRRMLVAGDWLGLGFQKEEHYKLARIGVDLPNLLDEDWDIDIKKSRARPPDQLRPDLRRIAEATRRRAAEVYRHRGKIVARGSETIVFMWVRQVKSGKFYYTINREHPLVREILSDAGPSRKAARALLRLLEETVPVPAILIDGFEKPEQHAEPFESASPDDVREVAIAIIEVLRKQGLNRAQAKARLISMEPFPNYPEIVEEALEQFRA